MIHGRFKYYIWILFILAICVSFYACEYDEGDKKAAEAFSKMTTQEKILYDAVNKQWSRTTLLVIRNAIREGRDVKPAETDFPFKDIPNIIKSNNSVTMVRDSAWGDSTWEKYEKAKWSNVAAGWYRELTGERRSEDREKKKIYDKVVTTENKSTPEEVKKEPINPEDYVPFEELDELRFLMKGCDEAGNLFNIMVTRGKPLTYDDRERILVRVLICEAERVNIKMKGN